MLLSSRWLSFRICQFFGDFGVLKIHPHHKNNSRNRPIHAIYIYIDIWSSIQGPGPSTVFFTSFWSSCFQWSPGPLWVWAVRETQIDERTPTKKHVCGWDLARFIYTSQLRNIEKIYWLVNDRESHNGQSGWFQLISLITVILVNRGNINHQYNSIKQMSFSHCI